MSNPEWYSGSDVTGRVAAGIEAAIQRMDAHVADEGDVERLDALLGVEQEVNWRCFLLALAGTIRYDLDQVDAALPLLEQAIRDSRVYLESFDDVLNVYCQACYTAGCILLERDRPGDAATHFLRCVPYMHEVYDEVYVGNILGHLETALARWGHPEPAVAFAEAAAYARGCDCRSLEDLMVAYARIGDLRRAGEVLELLEAECDDYEHIGRARDFARRHLGGSGVVN